MITTTLNRIREHSLREDGWLKLLASLGKTQADDEPLTFARIVEINGIDHALWCCRAEPQHAREWRLFAVWCARQVQHLMTDPRSLAALDVAERHANGQASDEELDAAFDAAWEASRNTPRAAKKNVARHASDAAWATALKDEWASAWDASRAASRAFAWDAVRDRDDPHSANWSDRWDAAWDK